MINFWCRIWSVGLGSAATIITANHKMILLDAGSDQQISPAAWWFNEGLRKSDLMIFSHPHEDHLSDLPSIRQLIPPDYYLFNPAWPNSLPGPALGCKRSGQLEYESLKLGSTDGMTSSTLVDPHTLASAGGVKIETFRFDPVYTNIAPDDFNNLSLLTIIRYEGLSLIFPGDLEPKGWRAMFEKTNLYQQAGVGNIRILLAPHHGKRSGIFEGDNAYQDFMQAFDPSMVIMSAEHGDEHTAYPTYDYLMREKPGLITSNGNNTGRRKILTTKQFKWIDLKVIDNQLVIEAEPKSAGLRGLLGSFSNI
jgi:beta-lactamase superfamily II metal-dependent hydrolase